MTHLLPVGLVKARVKRLQALGWQLLPLLQASQPLGLGSQLQDCQLPDFQLQDWQMQGHLKHPQLQELRPHAQGKTERVFTL